MNVRLTPLWALALAALTTCAVTVTDKPALPEFNRLVLDVAAVYPTDGTHDYWWPRGGESSYDGCTEDLQLLGERVMEGEPQRRTFCCGLTIEVFLKAYNQWIEMHGVANPSLTPENWPRFQRVWFVLETNGPGPSAALEEFGLGRTIERDEVLPGDFVQIWRRTGSGHSVVFLDWVRDDAGAVTGFRYWSAQPSTDGSGGRVEYFGAPDADEGVADEHTYWGRVELPLATTLGD